MVPQTEDTSIAASQLIISSFSKSFQKMWVHVKNLLLHGVVESQRCRSSSARLRLMWLSGKVKDQVWFPLKVYFLNHYIECCRYDRYSSNVHDIILHPFSCGLSLFHFTANYDQKDLFWLLKLQNILPEITLRAVKKATTKFIFVTRYINEMTFNNDQFEKHIQQIYKFINNRAYSNGVIIDLAENLMICIKFTRTLKRLLFAKMDHQTFEKDSISQELSVIHFDTPPFSYRDGSNKIIGIEGYVIDEFCRQFNLTYKVINDGKGITSMQRQFDISLYRRLVQGPQHQYDIITIYDAGSTQCFMVPKNIPMFSSRFSVPFDKFVNVLFLCSVLFAAILWKIICIYRKLKINSFDFVTSILKCIVGYSLPANLCCMKWSIKERLFLVPFLFMCFILMDLFTSFMISSLIVELPMRSVQSVQELNDSDLMIYEYYDQIFFKINYKLRNIVLNKMSATEMQTIPNYFDKNLVYVVNCKFAEAFIRSAWNFDNDQQNFNILRGFFFTAPYSAYLVHDNFPLKSEFIKMVSDFQEFGIMDFWNDNFIRTQFPKYSNDNAENIVTLSAMQLPLFILITGLCVSIAVFFVEWIYFRFMNLKLSRVIDLREDRQTREKWRRLYELLQIKRCRRQRKVKVLRRERTVFFHDAS